MAPKQKDITGQRFGRLIVLSEDSRRKRANRPGTEVFWKCLCDCGNTTVVKRGSLTSKTTQSCGCRKRDAVLARNKLCRKDGTALRSLYNTYQQRARKSGLVFELSIEDFQRITSEPCFYTGRLPEKEAKRMKMAKYTVEFSGTVEVEAECELEAECMASTECRPDNCRVISGGEDEDAS